jgi:uncharacterized membrane protein
MIVQLVVKGLFLYFAFLVIRSLLRGFTQVKSMKEAMENHHSHQAQGTQQSSKADSSDTVEAEFRRL